MAFGLSSYPVVYRAKFGKTGWQGGFIEKEHKTPEEEAALEPGAREALVSGRNFYSDMPLVSYTTQYGFSVFEGLKALPQKGGGLAIFRPDRNAARFHRSMEGLYMPPFPEDLFMEACIDLVRRNAALGFRVTYRPEWEKDNFMTADSLYLRPFTYSEGGIGVNISSEPWVIIVASPVSAYFSVAGSDAVVTDRVRATPKGTGTYKTASNYVIAALAKHEAAEKGYMECVFLDAEHHKYVEEGSSCNIFFYLKSGELVSPELGDTILPGITRASIIELARDRNIKTTERRIAIEEVLSETKECFVTGTAAGATPIGSLTWKGKKTLFTGDRPGELTVEFQTALKGIQYGTLPDTKGWMFPVQGL